MLDNLASAGLLPIKMCSASLLLDQFSATWELRDPVPDDTGESRRHVAQVAFDTPFDFVPLVHIGMTGLDIDNNDTARIRVYTGQISTTGFEVVVETWCNTRVYGVEVNWLALGQ